MLDANQPIPDLGRPAAGAAVRTARPRGIPKVFDKYMLPKVAFTLVTGASLAGAVLTGLRHGWIDWPLLAMRWLAYWFLAMLLGSEVWKIFYLRPSVNMRPVAAAVEYGEAMIALHRRWQKVLAPLGIVLACAQLAVYGQRHPDLLPWVIPGHILLLSAAVAMVLGWQRPIDTRRQNGPDWTAFLSMAAAVAAMGTVDVLIQSGQGLAGGLLSLNRTLHLWAFSAWLGGALWNIFIAVPAGVVRENMDTVILANFQLERFRVVVRTVFPTIVASGLVQAWAMFGWSWEPFVTTTWGWLVLLKLGMIASLVVVFITCPMWGACSPIRGVCNLDDLFEPEEE